MKKPLKIALAIIENEGKILVSKVKPERVRDFNGLQYVFPGGKVEQDETLEDALVREIKTETGLMITPIGQVSYNVDPVTKKDVYYYHCQAEEYKEPLIIDNSNTDKLLWVEFNDLDKYHSYYCPDVKEYISFIVKRSVGI